jgi:uncharacterized protein YjdB
MRLFHCALGVAFIVTACSDASRPTTDASSARIVEVAHGALDVAAGVPAPDEDDRVLIDTRQSLQSATSLSQALAAVTNDVVGTFAFTPNVDGNGTKALRIDWQNASGCTAREANLITYLPSPRPKRLVVQWTSRYGRTATGGGIGANDSFGLLASDCGRGERSILSLLRDVPDGGPAGRMEYRWEATSNTASAPMMTSGGRVASDADFVPTSLAGRTVTTTVFVEAERSAGAGDGLVKIWVDGELVTDRSNVSIGVDAFHRFQLPGEFETVPQNQSEYLWDIVAWEPVGNVDIIPPILPVASVEVSPDTVRITTGQSATMTATARDALGNSQSGRTVTWRSTNAAVATVNSTGQVTGVSAGTARIAATVEGRADTATAIVTAAPVPVATVTVSLTPNTVDQGQTSQAAATARDAQGNALTGRPVTWSSNNTSVATVTAAGVVNGVSAGTAQITATVEGKTGSAPITVNASAPPPPATGCSGISGAIFCDDFDTNRLSSYFEYDQASGGFTRQSGAGRNGGVGMRARWSAGQVTAGSLKLAFGRTPDSYFRAVDAGTTNYRNIYWRIWMRPQAGWQANGNDKMTRAIVFAGANWSEAAIGHVWGGSGSAQNFLVMDPASGTDTQGNLRTTGYNDFENLRWLGAATGTTPVFGSSYAGQWICVESHMRLNDAGQSNGVFETWVNGTLDAQRTGLNWVGSYNAYGINAIFLEAFINNGAPQAQVRDYDDFVVGTQRIGCGGSAPPGPAPVATVSVSLSPSSVPSGETSQATATARDSAGNVLTGRPVSWSSSNTSVATVSASGVVNAVSQGSAQIRATVEGRTGTATLTVTSPAPAPVATVTVTMGSYSIAVGSTTPATATARDSSGNVLTGRPVTWRSSDTRVATVSSSGIVRGVGPGSAQITATVEGKSGSASVTVTNSAPAPVATVSVSLASSSIQPGSTTQATATARDANGNVLTGRSASWTSSNTGVATVSSSGLVSGSSAGSAQITATIEGKTGSATITVTSTPPPPSGGNPQPDANDRMVLDTRQSLQQANSQSEAMAMFPDNTNNIGFSSNVDGNGTNAYRLDWGGRGSNCTDDGKWMVHYISGTRPKSMYMQWKMRMGRTSTGGGIGSLDSFQITNSACGNAGRKMFLVLRDVPDQGSTGRVDYVWPGPAPVQPRFEGAGTGDLQLGMNKVNFQPQNLVGQVVTHTLYLQAESAAGRNDGVIMLWVNGDLKAEYRNVRMGTHAFHRFQWPTIFRAPQQDQTEYIWDIVAWEPR